jgi:protein subunit release factor B
VETARGTGPGGQHRNTRDTAVRAWHADYPDIVITRNSGRSQTVNVDDAHSAFEGWVKHHATGQKWPLRVWEQGRFTMPRG